MTKGITPTPADVGRPVIYTGNRYPGGVPERGVIHSFNERTVFVRYDGKLHSQGTNPADLEWEFPGKGEEGYPT